MSKPPRIIRAHAMQLFEEVLDQIVLGEPALSAGARELKAPAECLRRLAEATPGALANDISAIRTFQHDLFTAGGDLMTSLQSLTDPLGKKSKRRKKTAKPTSTPDALCDPGVLFIGALVPISLAAARVGSFCGHDPDASVDALVATALGVLPVDHFARQLRAESTSRESVERALERMLSDLAKGGAAYANMANPEHLFDACDIKTAECIYAVTTEVKRRLNEIRVEWDGARSTAIANVAVCDPDYPERLRVTLRALGASAAAKPASEEHADTSAYRLIAVSSAGPSRRLRRSHEPLSLADVMLEVAADFLQHFPPVASVAQGLFDGDDGDTIEAELPDDAEPGWLAVTTEHLDARMRETRQSLRRGWDDDRLRPCLAGTRVPVEAIPTEVVPTAPKAGRAVWGPRIADVDSDSDPWVVRLERPWPGVWVRIRSGNDVVDVGVDRDAVEAQIPPSPGATIEVRIHERVVDTWRAPSRPGDGLRARARNDGLRIAFLRPVLAEAGRKNLERTSRKEVEYARDLAERALGLRIDATALPWLDDEDLVIEDELRDAHDPASLRALERLEHIAVTSTGLEEHVLVALVPPHRGYRVAMTVAARGLVISDLDSLPAALREVMRREAQLPMPRRRTCLRLVGFANHGVRIVEPTRLDDGRLVRGSDETLNEVLAVAYAVDGRVISEERIRTINPSRRGPFAMLLPITDDTARVGFRWQPNLFAVELQAVPRTVEVRIGRPLGGVTPLRAVAEVSGARPSAGPGPGGLPSLYRPSGDLDVSIESVTRDAVAWRYRHSGGVRPTFEIEVGDGSAWRTIARAAPGVTRVELDLEGAGRDADFDRVRVVASDGWNVGATQAQAYKPGRDAVVRRVRTKQFWLDDDRVGAGDKVKWRLDGQDLVEARGDELIALEKAHVPAVTLSAESGGYIASVDLTRLRR